MTDAPRKDVPSDGFDVVRVLVWALVVAVVAAVVVAAFVLRGRRLQSPSRATPADAGETDAPPPPPTTGLFERPVGRWIDVPAVERSGRELRTADLLGRYLLVDFVFRNCGGTCPQLQAALRKVQDATAKDADVGLVSITVDPANDTPEVLRAWADATGADPERWLFLRIAEPDLRPLMKEGLKVPTADDLVIHSNRFVLVAPDGAVVAHYSPLDEDVPNWMDLLLADLAKLRAERGPR